ncbi:molybdopterin cofactor-binding domain-containing protein [Novosphingobium piscinae]|uniref:Xanthine dehydrogenase family protein molybdopterin-binding subunit n=1 Tax=Novosphingobium piscinae TaxID=1507448 RepID=A0A7X1FVK8_9SPHN|nr:molybdopterin cofactor-binding domain-containing protein [Novosphingobium piscinae]MBC2667804.1 xanthine dehydrogenase family protein molybdopterin-binding subunit [Novosphingobium piscinae]
MTAVAHQSDTIAIHGAQLSGLSRRGFLGVAGTMAAVLAIKGGPAAAAAGSAAPSATTAAGWIEIRADNTVLLRTGKCDFGQSSIYTAYRQIVAEELCVPLAAMTEVVSGDTDRTPDGGGTFGLLRNAQNLRKVAALLREAALELASRRLGVARAALSVRDGILSGGGKAITYGELVRGEALQLTIPLSGDLTMPLGLRVEANPPLKPVKDYTIIGQPVPNPSLPPKIAGETVWVGDVKLPGMLHARVIHPETLGSTLIEPGRLDRVAFPGAQLVRLGHLLAVASPDEWEAVQAAQAVAAGTRWSDWQGLPDQADLPDQIRRSVAAEAAPPREGRANAGDPAQVRGAREHRARYAMPFQKHAPISPMVSLADYRPDGSVTLHTHSQNPQHLRRMIALMLGTGEDRVVVRTYPGAGHYGRSNGGSAGSEDEAVLLSRALGRPVRVQWMRHDDMQWSTQSSAMVADIRIALGGDGRISAYEATHSGPGMQDDRLIGAVLAGLPTIAPPSATTTYGFQSSLLAITDTWIYGTGAPLREIGKGCRHIGQQQSPHGAGLRNHSMRTPLQFQQNCPREIAITEAALLAGKDPLQFRLDHVPDPRFQALLIRLRDESGWTSRPSPAPGARATGQRVMRGQGLALMLRDNGYWACAAMVAVTPATGEVKVERITIVADVGIVINPLQLRRQIQAGCLMGVSQALFEEVPFDRGKVTATDWASYPILTMADMPELKVVIADNPGVTTYGQGSESANALAAPAIAGAVLDATGKPVRRIPLRPDLVLAALRA